MKDISNRIKELRTAAGLTQDELAERLFVTRQAVSNWETRKTRPDVETLEALARVFGLELTELLYGKATPTRNRQYIKPTIIFGVLFLLGWGLPNLFKPFLQQFLLRYQLIPYFVFLILERLLRGCFFPMVFSFVSIFADFSIQSRRARKVLLICGAVVTFLFLLGWVAAVGLGHLPDHINPPWWLVLLPYVPIYSQWPAILAGGLLWLGIKQPQTKE